MIINFFNYTGNKRRFINIINPVIELSEKDIYVEPFVGSGAIFFNLTKKFKKYIINDIDKNIIKIYNTFKEIEYIDYKEFIDDIEKNFGDIKENKESYYSFRNYYNKNFFNTGNIVEGLYIHVLANSCINSKLRFSSKGMNAAFGNRKYILNKNTFDIIKEKLQQTEIYCTDYLELMNFDACYFLDPPYFTKCDAYKSFELSDFKQFLDIIKNKEYIYTDILNEFNKDFKNKTFLRNISNTSPQGKKSDIDKEYLFFNLNKSREMEIW